MYTSDRVCDYKLNRPAFRLLLWNKNEVQLYVDAKLFEPLYSRKHGGLDVFDVFGADVLNRIELVTARSKDKRVVELVQLGYVYHALFLKVLTEFFELSPFFHLPKHDIHKI